jgi:hypothetical protein
VLFFPSYVLIPIVAAQLNPLVAGVVSGVGAGMDQYLHYRMGVWWEIPLLR